MSEEQQKGPEELRKERTPAGDTPAQTEGSTNACPECGGSGKVESDTNCPKCGGTGVVKAAGGG